MGIARVTGYIQEPEKERIFMSEMIHRTKTRPVRVGNLTIGGSNELFIQSMCTTKTHDVEATVAEIFRLEEAGCQISSCRSSR